MNFLLLAFEGDEAQLLARLAERLKADGHGVFVVSCDHYTVTHLDGITFRYYRSVDLQEGEFADLSDFYTELNRLPEDLHENEVDWDYIREFEDKYCRTRTLLELAAMDPIFSSAFHHRRIYYRPENKAIFFKMLELQARWLDRILGTKPFDAVFTVNFQYFVKAAIFTMAEAKAIPFLVASSCRIADLQVLYDNFSLGTPGYVLDEMERLKATGAECREAKAYVESLVAARRPAYAGFETTLRRISVEMSISYRLKILLRKLAIEWKWALFGQKRYRGALKSNYYLPGYLSVLREEALGLWRRIGYFRHKRLTGRDLPNGPFVFFPLHLMPENSVLTLSRTFSEMECIFQLSKVLPPDWKIVVKINPNMLTSFDNHPNRHYLEMAELPNVQFVHPGMSSGEIIARASAVAAISGTALLEGAIYGKPGFRWGRTEFEVIDIIHEFDPPRVREQLAGGASENLLHYIQACFNLGFVLDVPLLGRSLSSSLTPEQTEKSDGQLDDLQRRIIAFLKDCTQARAVCRERSNCIS